MKTKHVVKITTIIIIIIIIIITTINHAYRTTFVLPSSYSTNYNTSITIIFKSYEENKIILAALNS